MKATAAYDKADKHDPKTHWGDEKITYSNVFSTLDVRASDHRESEPNGHLRRCSSMFQEDLPHRWFSLSGGVNTDFVMFRKGD